ncbi:sugar transferase [Corynebacterium nasicanis]|uniref:Sugar transferase n=1 Tax=Corynebacterium nasicanis TaxID=1448267 RepID=A0ABW1QDW8_9CORY
METPRNSSRAAAREITSQNPPRRTSLSSPSLSVVISDAVAITLALLLPSHFLGTAPIAPGTHLALILAGWMLTLTALGVHSPATLGGLAVPFRRIVRASLLAFGAIALLDVTFLQTLPSILFSLTLPLGLVLIVLGRMLVQKATIRLSAHDPRMNSYVVLGAEGESDPTLDLLARRGRAGVNVVGHICAVTALKSACPVDHILREVLARDSAGILLSPHSGLSAQQVQSLRWALEGAGRTLSFLLPIHGVSGQRLHVQAGLRPSVVDITPARYHGAYFRLKRCGDVILAGLGLLVLAPALLIIALCIKLSDGGPVFFSQVRVGRHGEHFTMFKFRTMRIDAEEVLQDLLEKMELERDCGNEVLFKLKCDPRVTRVGGFLRRYSLDELPQLLNTLRGDMTLIGPRPPLPREVAAYEPQVMRKFLVKPGLTGLWQTMGRSTLSWEDSVYLDLYYAENCGPLLDLRILLRTIQAVLSKDGAF